MSADAQLAHPQYRLTVIVEGFGLLDMERLEVLVPGIGLEPGNRLRLRIDALIAVALSLGKIGEVLALHPLVCGVVAGHRLSPSVESQFTLGFDVSSTRCSLAHISRIESRIASRGNQTPSLCQASENIALTRDDGLTILR